MSKSNRTLVFCDSKVVLDKLLHDGMRLTDSILVTRSFSLTQHTELDCIYIDGKLSADRRFNFKKRVAEIENALVEKLKKSVVCLSTRLIFIQLFNSFQNCILDALILQTVIRPKDKIIVAVPITGNAKIDEVLYPSWIEWLGELPKFEQINVVVEFHNERSPRGDTKASVFERLRMGGPDAALWKLAQQKWSLKPLFKSGIVGVVGQAELAREVVASCLLHRLKPTFFETPKIEKSLTNLDYDFTNTLIKSYESFIFDSLSLISNKFLQDRAKHLFIERLTVEMCQYRRYYDVWQEKLASHPDLNIMLAGFLKGANAMAFADVCKERDIAIVAFQHGITREIISSPEERRVFYETAYSDLFFTMNKKAAEVTKRLCLKSQSNVLAKYWPFPYTQIMKKLDSGKKTALFVSTNLYAGHKPNGVSPVNDKELCDIECGLVERVLGRADHFIDYKPYPAIRHLDPDPVLGVVERQQNMSVVGTHQDLRYMLSDYKMFITTKATSTVSWIVGTGKPLVFIDHPYHARLSEEAQRAFLDGFFYFDQSQFDFEFQVKTFLGRTFDDILMEWKTKSARRSEIVEKFFGGEKKTPQNQIFEDIKFHFLKN